MTLSICCFASGSKGNCTLISDGQTNILIDMGITASRAEAFLGAMNIDPDDVDIAVTHTHSDHIAGIKVFCKHHPGARVHCQRESARQVAGLCGVTPIEDGREADIGGIRLTAVPVPHDVPCVGYIAGKSGRRIAVVTDIGEVRPEALNALCACDVVMLESNHDVERLRKNPTYSAQLKLRIASSHGHLSNAACAEACAYLASHGVKNFILAHLSEDNNDPELAAGTVTQGIIRGGVRDARVVCALQNKPTGLFEVC